MNIDPSDRLASFWTVKQLRDFMRRAPDDMPIGCQVVGQEGGAWMMSIGAFFLDGRMHLRVHHPDLRRLPDLDTEADGANSRKVGT